LAAIPIPFVYNFWGFLCLLWFLMFFGGATLPSLTGIMLNMVQSNQKTTANSIAYLIFNIFGYLPSPFIYGFITDYGNGNNEKTAIACLMYMAFIPVICFSFSTYYIFKEDILGWKKQEQEIE
jgi:MFS family permease